MRVLYNYLLDFELQDDQITQPSFIGRQHLPTFPVKELDIPGKDQGDLRDLYKSLPARPPPSTCYFRPAFGEGLSL